MQTRSAFTLRRDTVPGLWGVYSGRYGVAQDEMAAQLGRVWHRQVVDEIISAGVCGSYELRDSSSSTSLYLGRKLHRKATAGTSFWYCFFSISDADSHRIRDGETEDFRPTLKACKRTYLIVLTPVLAAVFVIYLCIKSQ